MAASPISGSSPLTDIDSRVEHRVSNTEVDAVRRQRLTRIVEYWFSSTLLESDNTWSPIGRRYGGTGGADVVEKHKQVPVAQTAMDSCYQLRVVVYQ